MLRTQELRKQRDLSQYDLAKLVGVHPHSVYLWEAGAKFPRRRHLEKIADALGCNIGDLFEPVRG